MSLIDDREGDLRKFWNERRPLSSVLSLDKRPYHTEFSLDKLVFSGIHKEIDLTRSLVISWELFRALANQILEACDERDRLVSELQDDDIDTRPLPSSSECLNDAVNYMTAFLKPNPKESDDANHD